MTELKEGMKLRRCSCGSFPELRTYMGREDYCSFVKCYRCGAETRIYYEPDDAIDSWNKGEMVE